MTRHRGVKKQMAEVLPSPVDMRQVPGIAHLDPGTVERVLDVGRLVHIPSGWTPIRADEPADEAWLILEGGMRVVADDAPIADLGPGSFVGEMGLVGASLRSARVTVTDPVLAVAWPRDDFELLRHEIPEFNELVTRTAADRRHENGR